MTTKRKHQHTTQTVRWLVLTPRSENSAAPLLRCSAALHTTVNRWPIVYMFSERVGGFSPGTVTSSHSLKTSRSVGGGGCLQLNEHFELS